MTTPDTSSFFTTHQSRDVPRDQWGRYKLPGPGGQEESWTRATTFAATLAEQYGLRIWKERQVVWGLSRRPDLMTMASTIVGPEDKKALGEIVTEAHIAAGTDAKANRGTAIHLACAAAERGAWDQVPEELRPHVADYLRAMREGGLEILPQYVERTGIVKLYGVAGTLDNLVRCPDGKLRVADKKTGRLDYSDVEFSVQMALYSRFDALFNYDTGQYEQMPEVATDYAILAHIDPVTGKTELQRINIEWGWVWAKTCAEVRDIRQTKHVITPYVAPERSTGGNGQPAPSYAGVSPLDQAVADLATTQVFGTVPGGYVDSTSSVLAEYQAFWSDDRHDEAGGPETLTYNGVPLSDYERSVSNVWGCSRGEPCEFTGDEGLHSDGTVCLYGNARPDDSAITAPAKVVPAAEHPNPSIRDAAAASEPPPSGLMGPMTDDAPRADTVDPDELVAKIDGLKGGKAAVQNVARKLMADLGIKEGEPGAIKLSQYKIKIARACVDLAFARGVSIDGFGKPSGPAPNGDASAKNATPAQAPDDQREEKIRTAVESIMMQSTIAGIQERHTYYSGTSLGWTDEMQTAARTRAAAIELESGETSLSPLEMIQGATSRETLSKAWDKATGGGSSMAGWTEALNAAALAKQTELAGGAQ